ncbi:histone-lysine N-methyltransferase SUV39H2 [Aphelenchoides avenae]|nr:histone-lysine N-methyltransferase SUV39H2 [Aphelenchus avenae]
MARKYEDFFMYDAAQQNAHCMACLKNIKRKDYNSTGMKRHLERVHPQLAALVETDNANYEVERITGKNIVGNVILYCVKWAGWGAEYSTWEPLTRLWGAAEAVVEYEAGIAGA